MTLLIILIVFALLFDFVNGFHDASNSIATIISTGVLKPRQAVMWAAFFNFLAILVFDTGVAHTVGNGMIDLQHVTLPVILAGLAGATLWGLITWWFKLPTSSSHALIGGYAGAAMGHHAFWNGWSHAADVIISSGWNKTLMFIVLAPALGMMIGALFMAIAVPLTNRYEKEKRDVWFGRMQLASSAFLSLTHGGNDAQKTAGIVTGALLTAGVINTFNIPMWVLVFSYGTMALGTLFGGWRIVETMGHRLTRLKPRSGFCAETGAALSIMVATLMKLPVSTTHVTTGAILGTGAVRNHNAVRWNLAGNIVIAWLMTIPAAAILGGIIAVLLSVILGA